MHQKVVKIAGVIDGNELEEKGKASPKRKS